MTRCGSPPRRAPARFSPMVVRRCCACSLALLLLARALPAHSQVVFDGSLGGPAGPAQTQGTDYRIPVSAGRVPGGGASVFHSFSAFGIETGHSATFFNDTPQAISRVISRVTGGSPSEIYGTLRSTIGGADLWLLNPAGVVFGPGARLDLPAGLHVSTAESVRLADGTSFAATPQAGESLSAAAPVAFGFLGPAAGNIVVLPNAGAAASGGAPSVSLPYGTLELGGADVDVAGSVASANGSLVVSARGGIDVHDGGSLSANGTVSAGPSGIVYEQASLSLTGERVSVVGPARAEGATPMVSLRVFRPDGGSRLEIRAGDVVVTTSAAIETAAAFGKAPPITIESRTLDLRGAPLPAAGAADPSQRDPFGGGTIRATGQSAGAGGDILIDASEWVRIAGRTADNQWAGIQTQAGAAIESPAAIVIDTPLLELGHEGQISNRSAGRDPNGRPGAIEIDVGELRLEDGARIEVDTSDTGNRAPGTLRVRASGSVTLIGRGSRPLDDLVTPTALSAVQHGSEGAGGAIEIAASRLVLRDGAVIDGRSIPNAPGDASSLSLRVGTLDSTRSFVVADSQGSGRAGSVDVRATDSVSVDGGGIGARTYGSGAGGAIQVRTPLLVVSRQGELTTVGAQRYLDVPAGGESGDIVLDVGRLVLRSGGGIRSNSRGDERGGDITVRAAESVELLAPEAAEGQGNPATMFAGAQGDGPAGDIRIETPRLLVGELARIETSTTGDSGGGVVARSGRAGDVRIAAGEIVVAPGARIASASTGLGFNEGNAGSVVIDAGSLSVYGDGSIATSTSTRGSGGAVVVRASRSVALDGLGGAARPNIASSTSGSSGSGGAVLVETPALELRGGAGIGASSTGEGDAGSVTIRAGRVLIAGGSEVASDSLGTGRSGVVRVEARDVLAVQGSGAAGPSGIATRSAGPAKGGSIEIAAGTLDLSDSGSVSASSAGSGDAGDIAIRVAGRFTSNGGSITTSAPQADGGNISLEVGDRVELRSGRISADVTGGRGGNIFVQAAAVILDASGITAEAGAGQGGAIRIIADVVLQSQDSVVSAAAGASGVSGTVRIETPERDVTKALEAMPVEFVDAVTLLHERCAARRGAKASFVVADAAPPIASDLLPVSVADHPEARATRVALVVEPSASDSSRAWHISCGG